MPGRQAVLAADSEDRHAGATRHALQSRPGRPGPNRTCASRLHHGGVGHHARGAWRVRRRAPPCAPCPPGPATPATWSSRSSSIFTQRTKSPGGEVGLVEHRLRARCRLPSARPPTRNRGRGRAGSPGRARPRASASSPYTPGHLAQDVAHPPAGQPCGAWSPGPAGLEHDQRHAGGELLRGQALPQPLPQALDDQQVGLGVDPGQLLSRPARRSRRRGSRDVVSTWQTLVEGARDRVGAPGDPLAQRLRVGRRAGDAARPTGRGPPARRSRGTGARAAPLAAGRSRRRRPLPTRPRRPRSAGGRARLRSDEARSRRACGERALKPRGSCTVASASTAAGKRSSVSRRTCRSSVSTCSAGSPGRPRPGSITTASPANRPVGTRTTSPARSFSSDAAAAARRWRAPSRARDASRSRSATRRPAYSAKSPRWQVIASA